MALLLLSFVAGVLTVAAPCVLPLLPVIIGGSLVESDKDKPERQWLRPLLIAASLAASVIIFTLLIKATTTLLGVPQIVWQLISGGLVASIGLLYLWPKLWEPVSNRSGLFARSSALLGKAYGTKGRGSALLIGAALGPVFNSCSPTYALIVATVLPASFTQGLAYLGAYAIGMSAMLLMIAYFGQAVVAKLGWLTNPGGWFKRLVGVLFLAVGLSVIFGLDKQFQAFVLEQGWYGPIERLEQRITH